MSSSRSPAARVTAPGFRWPLSEIRHLALVGTTASAKSALALEVARRLGGVEIVSVDSMQVYRGMDIGTAKPSHAERAEIPHHLLDLADPSEDFSVARFQVAARAVLSEIEARGNRALLVGGTGLYFQAVVDGLRLPGDWPELKAGLEAEAAVAAGVGALHARLAVADPTAAARIEPSNARRVVRALEVTLGSGQPFSSFGPGIDAYPSTPFRLAGVWLPRAVVGQRIAERYQTQMRAGFLDEVRRLGAQPGGLSRTARQALGYRELLDAVGGERTVDESVDVAVRRTREFARRQRSWFRRDPRITWFATSHNPVALLPALLGDWEAP
ncbi:MAG TPA: tRNA (adenosine(37)-N6)-dimethylallyltransferase MiaA [Acidimicrobiales bacterium]|nr:tRNA (adenosine(37)-N6)-dimethylallyltransferase MiaA [Acidimicrobiales bacterium]